MIIDIILRYFIRNNPILYSLFSTLYFQKYVAIFFRFSIIPILKKNVTNNKGDKNTLQEMSL